MPSDYTREEALAYLHRAINAAVFGIPAEETAKLHALLDSLITPPPDAEVEEALERFEVRERKRHQQRIITSADLSERLGDIATLRAALTKPRNEEREALLEALDLRVTQWEQGLDAEAMLREMRALLAEVKR